MSAATPDTYVDRMDRVHAELWSLLAPRTEHERRIVAWMRVALDLPTLETLRNMVARGSVDGARARGEGCLT